MHHSQLSSTDALQGFCKRRHAIPFVKWVAYPFHSISKNGVSINKTTFTPEGRKEIFYLTTHSTHFIYGYMASDIW